MLKFLRNWKTIFGLALAFVLVSVVPASASSIAAPTVLKINSFKSYSLVAPVISGVTPKDTNVLVYIDDIFAGNAKTKSGETTSESFYFQAFGLETGTHSVYLVAENKTSLVRSLRSAKFNIMVSTLPAPTLVVPNEDTITGKVKPMIEGFTKSGTFVHLYIDGVYNGKTEIVEHVSGTAHFAYSPFLNLNVGSHKMWAVSEDIDGRKSLVSKVLEFNIEEEMPAPTIYGPVVNNSTVYNQPYVVGLAKNNSKIRIFIDRVFVGEFKVENHDSGTANFAYQSGELTTGDHFVYVTSVDSRGKESVWSNIVYFEVASPRIAMISDAAVEEDAPIAHEEIGTADEEPSISDDDIKKVQAQESTTDDEIDINIKDDAITTIDSEIATDTPIVSGSINEAKKQQNKLGWNAIIFMAFLASVIAWIFWVNRELIKEKKEQEEGNNKKN